MPINLRQDNDRMLYRPERCIQYIYWAMSFCFLSGLATGRGAGLTGSGFDSWDTRARPIVCRAGELRARGMGLSFLPQSAALGMSTDG